MNGTIRLIRTTTGWSAHFSGNAAEEVISLFGTNVIPTAFTAEAPASAVQQQLEAGWPNCMVVVA